MATYQTGWVTAGIYNPFTQVFDPFSTSIPVQYTATGGDGTSFTPGDTLHMNGPGPFDFNGTFIGSVPDGIVLAGPYGLAFLFSTVDPSGAPLPVDTTDPFVVCFLAGTLIATPVGDRRVEDLAAGDLVLTADGQTRPVLWIGRQTIASLFAEPLRSYPIRISAGALDQAVPARDLYVSPDHALLIDGVLVQAGALVNGTSITRVSEPQSHFVYYHIELEDHALVLAEGAVAETFVDNVTRRRFNNYAEYEMLFGDREAHIDEMELPRVKSARQLSRSIREHLAMRAAALGFTVEKAA